MTSDTPSQTATGISLRQVVEALLFAAPKPLTARQIVGFLNQDQARKSTASSSNNGEQTTDTSFQLFHEVDEAEVEAAIAELAADYQSNARGVLLQEVAGGYRFGTRPEAAAWVRQLFDETRPTKLSQPALETLAIIAYRQPIGRADIEAVRGVAVDGVVATLLERRLIKLAGRSEGPGRSLLYETTPEFLECFGLKGLDELPNADELRHIRLKTTPSMPAQAPPSETPASAEASSETPSETPAEPSAPESAA